MFNIPIVLLLFKRIDTTLLIVDRIREVKASKIYIMSDEGRNEEEKIRVAKCRKAVEEAIDWPCKVVKNYAEINRGVYGNIALGAKWVFEREECAIFLEDDNLPEITFFKFCEEMLLKYKDDTRILWICGTNYLGKYIPGDGASYMFTKHMLPCGWASWSLKFLKFYDGEAELLKDEYMQKRFKQEFRKSALYNWYSGALYKYRSNIERKIVPSSWDYQMSLSIRANSMFGISPIYNQIKNIGVDFDSTHGGNSFTLTMTKRFCGIETYPLEFPLKHPKTVLTDNDYEKRIDKIVIPPLTHRIKIKIIKIKKRLLELKGKRDKA